MPRTKHTHKWEMYCTYNGGGTDGSVRICSCGARKLFGVAGEKLVHCYARAGKGFMPTGFLQRFEATHSQCRDIPTSAKSLDEELYGPELDDLELGMEYWG